MAALRWKQIRKNDKMFSAHWRAHIVTPYHQCLRCSKQYNSSAVILELDGSLDEPSYIENLPPEERGGNQNVFPFSQAVAAMEVNLMLRYLLADDWWPLVKQQDYQFVTGEIRVINDECHTNCSFRQRRGQGDKEKPFYLIDEWPGCPTVWQRIWRQFVKAFDSLSLRS